MRGKNRAVVEATATEANVRSRVVTFAEGTDDVGEADAEKPSKESAGQPQPVSQAPSQHNTRSIHTVTQCCLLLSCSLVRWASNPARVCTVMRAGRKPSKSCSNGFGRPSSRGREGMEAVLSPGLGSAVSSLKKGWRHTAARYHGRRCTPPR